jgi:transcriptional regulator with XRE-family HTH domain
MKEFPIKLRLLRLAKNYTQAGLAYELERLCNIQVSQSTICRLESGRSMPDAAILLHLSRVFQCDINELITPHEAPSG